jgi:hypothetical protein
MSLDRSAPKARERSKSKGTAMPHLLISKLEYFVTLSDENKRASEDATGDVREFRPPSGLHRRGRQAR